MAGYVERRPKTKNAIATWQWRKFWAANCRVLAIIWPH